MKLIGVTLTLPGIAGLILTLGVAADANIVIFERIKEEARAGASIPRAITTGYAKALRTIIDANVVTIGVAFILFMLATAGIKGFAFTLGIGTLVSLFTAVLATSAILGSMSRTKLLRSKWALNPGSTERSWRFDYSGKSNWFFSASGVILVVCAFAIAISGINFGIDFESGTRIKTPLEQPANVDQVRDALDPIGLEDAEVQEVDDPELGKNVFQISTSTLAAGRGQPGADSARRALRGATGRLLRRLDRADVRRADRAHGADRDHRVADPDLDLHRAQIRVQVRGAGADRARARPPDHGGRLRALPEGGDDVDRGRAAHHLGLLALRHDHRVRPNTRERAAHAAGDLLPDRQPLDERGHRALAGHVVLDADAGARADAVRRRDAAGLRLRAARRHRLRRVSSIFIAAPVLTHWKEREPVYRRRTAAALQAHGGVVPAYADGAMADRTPRPTAATRQAPRAAGAQARRRRSGPRAGGRRRRRRRRRRRARQRRVGDGGKRAGRGRGPAGADEPDAGGRARVGTRRRASAHAGGRAATRRRRRARRA